MFFGPSPIIGLAGSQMKKFTSKSTNKYINMNYMYIVYEIICSIDIAGSKLMTDDDGERINMTDDPPRGIWAL